MTDFDKEELFLLEEIKGVYLLHYQLYEQSDKPGNFLSFCLNEEQSGPLTSFTKELLAWLKQSNKGDISLLSNPKWYGSELLNQWYDIMNDKKKASDEELFIHGCKKDADVFIPWFWIQTMPEHGAKMMHLVSLEDLIQSDSYRVFKWWTKTVFSLGDYMKKDIITSAIHHGAYKLLNWLAFECEDTFFRDISIFQRLIQKNTNESNDLYMKIAKEKLESGYFKFVHDDFLCALVRTKNITIAKFISHYHDLDISVRDFEYVKRQAISRTSNHDLEYVKTIQESGLLFAVPSGPYLFINICNMWVFEQFQKLCKNRFYIQHIMFEIVEFKHRGNAKECYRFREDYNRVIRYLLENNYQLMVKIIKSMCRHALYFKEHCRDSCCVQYYLSDLMNYIPNEKIFSRAQYDHAKILCSKEVRQIILNRHPEFA